MKIHLDYLEGRVEELENTVLKLNSDKKSHQKKYIALEDKLKSLQSEK
jgi:chaperonin cofactor prefoldin